MVKDGQKCLKTMKKALFLNSQNGQQLSKMVKNGNKLSKAVKNLLKLVKNGQKRFLKSVQR